VDCGIDVYEKTSWRARSLLDFISLRESLTGDPRLESRATAFNGSVIVGAGTSTDGREGVPGEVPLAWWIRGGPAIRLATLGGPTGAALALTESGVAVGYSDTAQGERHATLWLRGFPTDLTPGTGIVSVASSVSMSLTVVGEISQNNSRSGFRWTQEHGLETLGTLPGDFTSSLGGVNSAGVAVGNSTGPNFPLGLHATRCDRSGCVDLNTLVDAPGWRLEYASGISDQGVIGGSGQGPNIRAFLLRPLH